jgi:2-C-methyl-D-erythritol 4-phosphate cytidylyltransferase
MNRSQALAPLKAGEARLPCTVGAILRGQVRQASVRMGVDYYEEKGWLESTFILRGEANRVIMLKQLLEQHFGED